MPNLTPTQLKALDHISWGRVPRDYVHDPLIADLASLKLVIVNGDGLLEITDLGRQYLVGQTPDWN